MKPDRIMLPMQGCHSASVFAGIHLIIQIRERMHMQRKDKYSGGVYLRLSKEDGDVVVGTKSESNSISNQKSLITEFLPSRFIRRKSWARSP